MTTNVTFHGLCAFARQGKRYDVLLLPENGVHKPILTIPVVQIHVANTTVHPTTVGHDEAGNQIAMWDLTGVTIKMGTDVADPTFNNVNTGFALGLYHPGAVTKDPADLDNAVKDKGSKIELTSGSLLFDHSRPLDLIVKQKDGPVIIVGQYPSAVTWQGDVDIDVKLFKAGTEIGKIQLRGDGRPQNFTITNVARSSFTEGLKHFYHYYELIKAQGLNYQLELARNEGDIDVFDCVPPVALP